jgi:hypothetical protein
LLWSAPPSAYSVRGGRWLEIDLYWFEQKDTAGSPKGFCDRAKGGTIMTSSRKRYLFGIPLLVIVSSVPLRAQEFVNAQLPWHKAVFDKGGNLLAWYEPEKNLGYHKVVRIAWDFIEHKVPNDPATGVKVYLINAVADPKTLQGWNWQANPASTFGQFVDSLVGWYPYSGDGGGGAGGASDA